MVLGACCLVGATFVFSMMGGDFCVDPDVYSTQMVNLTSSGTTYYLNCQTPYPVYYKQVTDLLNSTAMLSESIMASKTQVTDASYSCQLRPYKCMTPYSIRKYLPFVCQYIVSKRHFSTNRG